MIDGFTKEYHCIHSDRAIKAIEEHGAPEYIRSVNGHEFIDLAIQQWLREKGIKSIYINSGCHWQNGYVESFNDTFRRECLNRELIYTLSESYVIFAIIGIYITTKDRIALWACSLQKRMSGNLSASLASVGLRLPSAREAIHRNLNHK
ncbi:MAG: integrase core domain-containing protein [Verrucomicrobiota bacterium]